MEHIIKIKKNRQKLYEGSGKIIYQDSDEDTTATIFFKDDLKYNDEIKTIFGKGVINNSISSFLMEKLDLVGIENHFIEKLNMREQEIQILDMIPLQVRVSNVAVGDYVSKFGVQEGYLFTEPMLEFKVKNPQTKYPSINETQIVGFNWMMPYEIKEMKRTARRVNDFLCGFFAGVGFRLVECSLEFGRAFNGEDFILMLADEITPESCKLWDLKSNYRFDLETIFTSDDPIEIYKNLSKRIINLKL